MQMQLKFQVELSTRLVCSQNRSLSVRRLASFDQELSFGKGGFQASH